MTKARYQEVREMLENLYAEVSHDRQHAFANFVDAEDGSEEERRFDMQNATMKSIKRRINNLLSDLDDLAELIAE